MKKILLLNKDKLLICPKCGHEYKIDYKKNGRHYPKGKIVKSYCLKCLCPESLVYFFV